MVGVGSVVPISLKITFHVIANAPVGVIRIISFCPFTVVPDGAFIVNACANAVTFCWSVVSAFIVNYPVVVTVEIRGGIYSTLKSIFRIVSSVALVSGSAITVSVIETEASSEVTST